MFVPYAVPSHSSRHPYTTSRSQEMLKQRGVGARMKIQQFLAPDAASLLLSSFLCSGFAPAASLSLSGRVTYGCVAGVSCPAELWDAGEMLVGCWWDAGGMPAGRDMLAPLAGVCCAVKYCCGEWSWHFVSVQPPGSGLLNFSCSPVAPVLPCTAPALCLAGRKQKTRSRLSWGALMPAQPFLHPRRDRGERDGPVPTEENKGLGIAWGDYCR